ncbi:MAG: hypothetical protein WDN44_09715 [Sphingomonas sp.]
MRWMLRMLAAASATALSLGAAHAQDAPSAGAPAGPGLSTENSTVRNPGDTSSREADMMRDQAILDQQRKAREGGKSGNRSVPALPAEVTVGSEVHDVRGAVIGTVDSVDMASAVVSTSVGKAAVPLEAFGKNSKGLLLGVRKEDFESQVAAANKPADAPAH